MEFLSAMYKCRHVWMFGAYLHAFLRRVKKNVFGLHGGLYSLCNAMRWVFLVFSHVAAWWPQTECRRFTTPYRHVYRPYTDDMPPHTDRTPSVHRLSIHHARRRSENKVYEIYVYVIFFSCRMPRKKKNDAWNCVGGPRNIKQ